MPAVIMESEDKETASFFGSASVTFEADIKNKSYITFDDNMLYCELKINGEKIGQRAFAAYEFEIPDKYIGQRVACELIFYSSYAPLFGEGEAIKGILGDASELEKLLIKKLRIVSGDKKL